MADTKISAMTSGVPAQDGDLIAAAREISPGVYGNVSLTAASVAARAAGVPSDFQAPIVSGRYYFPLGSARDSAAWMAADFISAIPFWSAHKTTWTKIAINVVTEEASTACRVGLYSNGSNNQPDSLIADFGEIDCSSSGIAELAISQEIAGDAIVWLAAVTNGSGTLELSQVSVAQSSQVWGWVLGASNDGTFGLSRSGSFMASAYGALPSSFTPVPDVTGPGILIALGT